MKVSWFGCSHSPSFLQETKASSDLRRKDIQAHLPDGDREASPVKLSLGDLVKLILHAETALGLEHQRWSIRGL